MSKTKEQVLREDGITAPPLKTNLDMSYLESTIGYMIRRAQVAVFHDIYEAFGEYRITTVQFSALAVVKDNPGATQAQLAAALGVERPRMVPILNELEKLGLAERRTSPEDRRSRMLFLTDKGDELLVELKKRFAKHQDRLKKHLSIGDEQEILDLFRRMSSLQEE